MSLRQKIIFIFFGVFFVIIITIHFIGNATVMNGFLTVEQDTIERNGLRVYDALQENIKSLDLKLADWAIWDDAYEFIKDKNETFITTNLENQSLFNININGMLFYNSEGNLVFGKTVDLIQNIEIPVSPELITLFSDPLFRSNLSPVEGLRGVIRTESHGLIAFATRAVHHSTGKGDSNGIIVFIRYLNDSYISELNDITHVNATILPMDELHTTRLQGVVGKQSAVPVAIYVQSPKVAIGSVPLRDVYGNDTSVIDISVDRTIYDAGLNSVRYLITLTIIILVVVLFIVIILLDYFVINRVKNISQKISHIGNTKDFSERLLNDKSSDEIHSLSLALNIMLEKLEDAYKTAASREELELKVKERTHDFEEIQKKLKDQNSEFEQKNKALEENKFAILNILDDAKNLEESLKKERDLATAIIASMAEGLFVVDQNGNITLMNSTAEELLGVTSSLVVGKPIWPLFRVKKGDKFIPDNQQTIAQVIREKRTITIRLEDDNSVVTSQGKEFPITSITAPLLSGMNVVGAVKIFRDATKEKQTLTVIEKTVAERTRELKDKNKALETAQAQISEGWLSIQREKARLFASINSLSSSFILTDTNHDIIYLNPAAKILINSTDDPENLKEIEPKLLPIPLHELHVNAEKSNSQVHQSNIIFGTKILELTITPISMKVFEKNETVGLLIMIEDSTERRTIERSRDEFFSIASHELRTPLTAIRGNTSLLLSNYASLFVEPDVKEMITDIHESSIRLISIVNDFLDTSRLEMQRMKFDLVPFDISDVIKEILREFDATGSQNKIAMSYVSDSQNLPKIFADRNKLKQVLMNLVGNSIKFTKDGFIHISVQSKTTELEVQIMDNGIGIPLLQQGLLFHKFQQAGTSTITRDVTQGTGLGLYISKLIMEGMGGSIRLISSVPGKETIFAFTIPIYSGQKTSEVQYTSNRMEPDLGNTVIADTIATPPLTEGV
jgi:PAS domain S-box-containing protein